MPWRDPHPSAAAASAFAALAAAAPASARAQNSPIVPRPHPWKAGLPRPGTRWNSCSRRAAESPPTDPSLAERRALAFAEEAVRLAAALPAAARRRLRERIEAALSGDATLIPIFHLVRTALLQRARGYEVAFTGLAEGTPWDLTIRAGNTVAEIACETVSAEEGRALHRGDWFRLVDQVNPELQTWLAAHPGRYLLKITLPEGCPARKGCRRCSSAFLPCWRPRSGPTSRRMPSSSSTRW